MLFMTPLQALIKNIIMIVILILLYKFYSGFGFGKWPNILYMMLIISAPALPFILNPVELNYSEAYLNRPENNFKLELDSLYAKAKLTVPPKTLSQGKHIISFMSLRGVRARRRKESQLASPFQFHVHHLIEWRWGKVFDV